MFREFGLGYVDNGIAIFYSVVIIIFSGLTVQYIRLYK